MAAIDSIADLPIPGMIDYGSILKMDELVLLYAEDSEEPYKVQRTLLTRVSKWFKAALSDRYVEGQKLEIRFTDTTKGTLELFLYWLFERQLPRKGSKAGFPPNEHMEDKTIQEAYGRLWVFADKHIIPTLENTMLGQFYDPIGRFFPTISTIRHIYENTGPGSSPRQLMVDVVCSGLAKPIKNHADETKVVFQYSCEDVGSLSDLPGFTEDLAKKYQDVVWLGRSRCDIISPITEYKVDEGGEDKSDSSTP